MIVPKYSCYQKHACIIRAITSYIIQYHLTYSGAWQVDYVVPYLCNDTINQTAWTIFDDNKIYTIRLIISQEISKPFTSRQTCSYIVIVLQSLYWQFFSFIAIKLLSAHSVSWLNRSLSL